MACPSQELGDTIGHLPGETAIGGRDRPHVELTPVLGAQSTSGDDEHDGEVMQMWMDPDLRELLDRVGRGDDHDVHAESLGHRRRGGDTPAHLGGERSQCLDHPLVVADDQHVAVHR